MPFRSMVEDDLEPLITRCPSCSTQFRVTENQLAVAGGRVRCGACLTVFQGTEHLILEDSSPFASGSEADAALDELLNELRDSGVRSAYPSAQEESAEPAPRPQIYGGFEEEQPEDEATVDPDDGAARIHTEADDAEADYAEVPAEEPDQASADDGEESRWVFEPEHDTETESPAVVVSIEEDSESGEPAGSAMDAEEIAADAWPEDDYARWIERDESALDRLAEATRPRPEIAAGAAVAGSMEADEAPAETDHATPAGSHPPISFAREPRRWWVGVVLALFGLAFAAQILYLQLPAWSLDPAMRPGYELACRWLGCELPPMRDLGRLQTRNLVVRSHPDLSGALVIDAVIVNQAGYPQHFPDLELRFSSVSGALVAGRRFKPEEYLKGELKGAQTMPPSTPVQVSLEIADPGPDAVNYTLSFR